jgi:Cu+-exporting ATPase
MHDHEMTSPSGKGRVTDPVCGMQVDADAPLQAHYRGTDYRFCSQHCLDAFEADAESYAHQSARPEPDAAGACCAVPAPSACAASAPGGMTYTCPMHPEVRRQAPGACPKCGMALEPMDAAASQTRVEYTCPMHPEIAQDHPGSCPKCGMALEPRTVAVDEPSAELIDMTRRFWISAVLAAPLFVLAMVADLAMGWLPGGVSMHAVQWVQGLLATPVVLWCGWPLLVRGWQSIRNRSPNMFTLIGLGVTVAWGYSCLALLRPDLFPPAMRMADGSVHVYFEAAAVITALVLLGQVLELRAGGARARRSGCCWVSPPTPRAWSATTAPRWTSGSTRSGPGTSCACAPARRSRSTARSVRAAAASTSRW